MDTVLTGLNFDIYLAYLDDIIIFSRDLDSYLERLERLFARLREANLNSNRQNARSCRNKSPF